MANVFEIPDLVIDSALKNGILIKVNNEWTPNIGVVTLVYHPGLKHYCFAFGTTAENASSVLLSDYKKLWKLKI